MCAMPHSALAGMTSDPRTGVVAQARNVHIVMEKEDFSDLKAALIRKLNLNVNKFYPDAGGILMGYQGIKMKRSTSEVNSTTLLHPIHIRAKFYLFKPTAGTELMCVVTHREVGSVKCKAHGVFQVELFSPPGCEETVFVGQSVVVKVEAVEQMAWQEPKIVGSLMEVSGDNDTPFIDIVENFDTTDNEFESVIDSGMFDNTSLSRGDNRDSIRQVREEVNSRGPEEQITLESPSPQVPGNTASDDADEKPVSKKRKIQEIFSPAGKVSSPAKKKNKKASKSPSSTTETTPKLPDTDIAINTVKFPVKSQQHPSAMPTPLPGKIQPKSLGKSKLQSSDVSPANKSSDKILPKILPKPGPAQDESDNYSEEGGNESTKINPTSKSSDPRVDGITKTTPGFKSSTLPNETVEPNLFEFQALTPAPPSPYKSPEPTKATSVPKTPKPRTLIPEGFKCEIVGKGKNPKPKLTAPDGVTVFRTYKGAHQWADDNPNYLIKSEPKSASQSLASSGVSGRSSPDMFDSQPEEPIEITPVLDGGDVTNNVAAVPPQTNAKQSKLKKKCESTPVANKQEKKKLNQQRLLIDQPSFSESEAEPQSQNLLIPESDTEYQSQSILAPMATTTKKKPIKDIHASPGHKTLTLVPESTGPKTTKLVTESTKKDKADKPIKESMLNKVPGKSTLDNEDDSGAESSFEPAKQLSSLPLSKSVIKQSPSTNVDASRTSSNSSDSEESSSDEEPPTSNKSVVEGAVKSAIPATSDDDDSSSFSSESDSDDDTVTAPMAATKPIETVVKKAVSSSSDSDSDSSEKSELSVKKFEHPVTVIVTDPIKTPTAAKVSSPALKKVLPTTKLVKTKTSSSSESDSGSDCEEQPKKKKKSKKKNATKSVLKTSLNTSEESARVNSTVSEKSPHLSSTVLTGAVKVKNRELVPDGISPILKSRHKKTTLVKSTGIPYFDQVMATSKILSQKSDTKPGESDSSASDNKKMKKKGKKVAGFL